LPIRILRADELPTQLQAARAAGSKEHLIFIVDVDLRGVAFCKQASVSSKGWRSENKLKAHIALCLQEDMKLVLVDRD
jgi:hypothetical protein